ncbi:NTPase (NACHT family) [Flavobacterium sp. TP390]|uniref:NTPase (NACHT family) n=1 Tax=Flavobacterium profundi TaxID=1774945 RepID=A0A6I4IJC2_9FLAO|nr:type I restriction enzyme HsdR N-terminal domain-containing protein [Flavobacterium profundi]MVO08039.1 NTPase (NACHT family) [Flavobacterium profundi]
MNEEDIRGKILLPYLQDLGFDISEIFLEYTFSIRLGKRKHVTGRSDILCKKNGKNLFVIELKNDSIKITQSDIDQGISYARLLLDDIAPFTIVSNGKQTRIFDSITRKELKGNISDQSVFLTNGYSLSTEEDLRIRYEALKNFISLSTENLKVFCESQVYDRMGSIIGGINSPYSKFVKELYVQRDELQTTFENFLNSPESIFGLVGNAGVGKTNTICSLALRNLEDKFVLFYNAAIINSPLECISQDLNIAFSGRSESDVVLKKLDEIGRFANKNVLVFIDAIDESINPNIAVELSEIALIAKNLDKTKIIISCKSNIWNAILKIKNKPTYLHQELNKYHDIISDLDNSPGFLLNDFSDKELEEIIPLYQKAFGFKGVISNSLLKELKNGFFLKIFSEVYSNKNVPDKISDKDLINKYLQQALKETNIGYFSGLRILSAIGNIIINYEYDSWAAYKDEGLDVNHLLEKLDFSLDNNIPEDLFTKNILIKSNKDDSYNVSFYYSKIRDYIICFHSYKLDKLSDDEFYNVLFDFYQNHIGKSALDFYIENASTSHLRTLVKFKQDKSLEYVISHNSYLDENFRKFKHKFDPNTDCEIGIMLPNDLIKNDGYALFRMAPNSTQKISYSNFKDFSNSGYDLWWEKGIKTLHGSNTSLLVKDQDRIVKKNIFEELKKILKKGGFTAYNSDVLLMEEVAVILYHYYKRLYFDNKIEEFYMPRYKEIYPIDLRDLQHRINRFRLTEFYRYKNLGHAVMEETIEKALQENINIPKIKGMGDVAPFEELFKATQILLEKGYDQIVEHYLPLPDVSINQAKEFYEQNRKDNWNYVRIAQFSEIQAKHYVSEFFRHLELAYKEFVDYCFPTYKDEFDFYATIPHEYFFYLKDSDILKWGTFGYRPSQTGEYEIHFKDSSESDEAFKSIGLKSLRSFSLDLILRIRDDHRYPVKTVYRINTEKVDQYCVIRNWVYKFLESDMRELFEENEVRV